MSTVAFDAEAQTQFYETTLHLQQPVVNISSVERVVYRWSTEQPFGLVTQDVLDDLTLELWTPGGLIHTDRIVVNGVAQPFAGIPREIGDGLDVYWRFDLDLGILEEMANVSTDVIEASSGLQFDVHDSISIPDDGRVSIKAYIDGINQDPHTDQLDSQQTTTLLFFDDFETGTLEEWSSSTP